MRNTNHKQLTTNTCYAAIHYSNLGISIASSLVQQNQLAASSKFITSFARVSEWQLRGIVFLHCSYLCKCTKHPLKDTVISTTALKNSFCSHYLRVLLAVLPYKILESWWVFKSVHHKMFCENVMPGRFTKILQAFLIKQLFHSHLLDMRWL